MQRNCLLRGQRRYLIKIEKGFSDQRRTVDLLVGLNENIRSKGKQNLWEQHAHSLTIKKFTQLTKTFV